MKKTMILYRHSLSIIFSIILFGFASCSKDNPHEKKCIIDNPEAIQAKDTQDDFPSITIEGDSPHNRDYYKLLDKDKSIFEWRAFQDGEFLFDTEIIWEIENTAHKISNIEENSFDIEFDNGNTIHVFNVSSKGSTTTLNIHNDIGELVNLKMDFDRDLDLIDFLSQVGQTNNAKVAPAVYGAMRIIFKVAVYGISVYAGCQAINCENLIKDGVQKCEKHSKCCRATKHSCSVSCNTTTLNCECNCPQYSTHG